jgi:hypothetical protein
LDSSALSSLFDNSAVAPDVSRDAKFDDDSRLRHSTHENPVTPYGKEPFCKDKAKASSDSTEWIPVVAGTEKLADVGTHATRGSTSVDVHEVNAFSTDQPLFERLPTPPLFPKHENGEQTAEHHLEPIQTHEGDMPDLATNSGAINDADVIRESPAALLQQPQPDIAQGMPKVSAKPTNYQAPSVEDQKDESENNHGAEKTSELLVPVESENNQGAEKTSELSLPLQLTAPKLPPRLPLPPPKWINYRNDLDNDHQKPADPSVSHKLSKRQSPEFKFCDPRAHHVHSRHLEGAAVEYFRAVKEIRPSQSSQCVLSPECQYQSRIMSFLSGLGPFRMYLLLLNPMRAWTG